VIAPLGASGFASASVPPSPCCAAMPCCLFCLGHDMGVTGINHIACRTPDVARLKAFKRSSSAPSHWPARTTRFASAP
jgi:hypothetical protein